MISVRSAARAGIVAAALALALAGCVSSDGPVKAVAEATGLATTPQESKPFVRATRRAEADYVPVGTVATREARRKTVPEFKTLEAELEAKRISNDAAGAQAKVLGATPPPKPAIVPTN
jgi:Flp pilus assembly protein TadD